MSSVLKSLHFASLFFGSFSVEIWRLSLSIHQPSSQKLYLNMANSNANTTAIVIHSKEFLQTPLIMAADDDIVAGAVDYNRRPAIRSKHGRWRSAAFIIGVEMAERLAYYGISANLISFLTEKLGQSTAMAAANVNAWSGVASLLPILRAVIADSFLGKYCTIIAASLVYILGLGLLTLSAMLPSLSCLDDESSMKSTPEWLPRLQIVTFFVALYLVAIGQGGHKPCVQAFGADQFDGEDPDESKARSSFFNGWYFAVSMAIVVGISVLSYVQDNLSWGLGFGIPCLVMVIALVIFLLGTMTYRYTMKCEGQSPFMRIGKVFVAAARNRNASYSALDNKEEAHGSQFHRGSWQFRFLEKALLASDNSEGEGKACSIDDIEEAKGVIRLFPIWVTSLIFGIVFAQSATLFTKQGVTLDRSISSSFAIPPASLQCFIAIVITVFIPIYDRVIVPVARGLTGKPAGITTLQRIGTGLFISIVAMGVAAVIEKKRLNTALEHGLIDMPKATIPMRIWWLVPQYALFGVAEVFTLVGLQEFFYDQAPNELRSVGMSLYLSIFGVGSLLSSFLVSIIDKATTRVGGESWFSTNLNRGHLDYFYWLLAGLSVMGLSLFMFFARSYIYKKRNDQV